MVETGIEVGGLRLRVDFIATLPVAKLIVVYLTVSDAFPISPGHIRCCRLENALRIAGVIIPGSDVRLYDIVRDAQTPYRFRTAVAHPGRTVYRKCFIEHQRPLRVGEVDHFALGLFLQGEEIKYPHLCQQALDKRQVALLILINLLAPRIVLLEIKLILPVMEVMFLQYLLHHLRYRFVDEKTMAAKLFIQQGEKRLEGYLIGRLIFRTIDAPEGGNHTMDAFAVRQLLQCAAAHRQHGGFAQELCGINIFLCAGKRNSVIIKFTQFFCPTEFFHIQRCGT